MLAVVEEETTIYETIEGEQQPQTKSKPSNSEIYRLLMQDIQANRAREIVGRKRSRPMYNSFKLANSSSILNPTQQRPQSRESFFYRRKRNQCRSFAFSPPPKSSLSLLLDLKDNKDASNMAKLQENLEGAKIRPKKFSISPNKLYVNKELIKIKSKIQNTIRLRKVYKCRKLSSDLDQSRSALGHDQISSCFSSKLMMKSSDKLADPSTKQLTECC